MLAMAKWLLEKGLDTLTEDEGMRVCLDLAAGSGNERILRLFRSEKIGS